MAGTYIGKYDTTAGSNSATASNSVSVAEGMLPSNINNAFRDIMADIRQWYNSAEWIEYGDGAGTYTATYASSTSFTIDGVNVTTPYHVGRRVKLVAATPGTIYGTITSSSFSTNTTVNMSWDSGSLSSEAITSVHIGVISAINTATPESLAITGDYTLDVSGDIILDADGGDVLFKDNGTTFGSATNTSGNLIIKSGTTTALTFSGADATLAGDLTISGDDLTMATNTSGAILVADDTNFNPVVVSGDLSIGTTGTAAIGTGVIVNADINGSAAIDASKIADGSVSSAEFQRLDGLTSDIQTQLDAKQATITGSATTIDTESLTATRALVSNSSQKVAVSDVTETELGYLDGVSSAIQTQMDTKAATSYVDNAIAGMRTRIICEAASTANVTIASGLEAGDAIDGVTLVAGDQVLLKDQSTASQNGIYTAVGSGAGAASRSTEYDAIAEISGQMVVVNQGSTNDNTIWLCTTDSTATLDSSSITFTRVTPATDGTVTSIGLSDGGASEFTIGSTPVTAAGTITIAVNSIAATKIADGSVTDAEFQRINTLSSNAQTQIDTKVPGKVEGTNFTDSLLVGHTTTGTLNAASENTIVGIDAGDAITSGDGNTILGFEAGTALSSSGKNTLIGVSAGVNITTGNGENIFIGQDAGKYDQTGTHNTGVGSSSLLGVSGNSFSYNNAFGKSALRGMTTGEYNIGIGHESGNNITSGSGNVVLGKADVSSATGDDQLSISDGEDGSVVWITGDSSGTVSANGGELTTTGKSLVMGF